MLEVDIENVRKANEIFYAAFETLDIQKMDPLWVQKDYVKCVHPGWEIRLGWPDVRDSWVLIFNHTYQIKFTVCTLDVVLRDNLAWVVCNEMISTLDNGKWVDGRVLSTNLFERQDDAWLLIHHHGSPILSIEVREEEEPSDLPMV